MVRRVGEELLYAEVAIKRSSDGEEDGVGTRFNRVYGFLFYMLKIVKENTT